jgi:hypothetical protein
VTGRRHSTRPPAALVQRIEFKAQTHRIDAGTNSCFRLHIHRYGGKSMNARSALFFIMLLGAFILGQSAAHSDQTSNQLVKTPAPVAQGSMARMSALMHLRPAPYSTARTGLILANCRPAGYDCERNSDCCSRKCCTDYFEECEGIGGTCDSWE